MTQPISIIPYENPEGWSSVRALNIIKECHLTLIQHWEHWQGGKSCYL